MCGRAEASPGVIPAPDGLADSSFPILPKIAHSLALAESRGEVSHRRAGKTTDTHTETSGWKRITLSAFFPLPLECQFRQLRSLPPP